MSGMIGKHTPGPWVHGFIEGGWGITPRIKIQNRCLLFVLKSDGNILPSKEDAQLIAAAPELLNCTRECLEMCKVWKDDMEKAIASAEEKQVALAVIAIIEAKCLDAIAKAEGDGGE